MKCSGGLFNFPSGSANMRSVIRTNRLMGSRISLARLCFFETGRDQTASWKYGYSSDDCQNVA